MPDSPLPASMTAPDVLWSSVGGCPFAVSRAKGAYLYDEAGNRYIDFLQAFGPLILGHAHPEVTEALTEQLHKVRRLICLPAAFWTRLSLVLFIDHMLLDPARALLKVTWPLCAAGHTVWYEVRA